MNLNFLKISFSQNSLLVGREFEIQTEVNGHQTALWSLIG